jgi:hypothetical protein
VIDADAGRALMTAILGQAREGKLLSDEHFISHVCLDTKFLTSAGAVGI